MAQRRHHYEAAFEAYLRASRIPYVAVDEARKALAPRGMEGVGDEDGALKSFDFVLYGAGQNLLAEVKGRRLTGARMDSWVTREDVDSLRRWEVLFGPEFEAAFVFLYWCVDQPRDGLFAEVFEHKGLWYAVRAARVRAYAAAMKVRSEKWGTVDVPRGPFERMCGALTGGAWESRLPKLELSGG